MSDAGESLRQQQTFVKAALLAGVDVVSDFQAVTFVKYLRVVLPLDGYVFWVRADQLSVGATLNAMMLNQRPLDAGPIPPVPADVLRVKGDLHYSTTNTQDEATSFSKNRMVFTTGEEVIDLNAVGSNVKYIAEVDGLRYTFSSRGFFQTENARLYHYVGDAVYADLASQLIERGTDLDVQNVVVSNSLPIWLAMNNYQNPDWEAFGNQIPLYPSFLVPDNLRPPYGSVHIQPDSTVGLASAPYLDRTYSHSQLTKEKVRVTLYGQRNLRAQDFVDFVMEQSLNYDAFGIMNVPILRDEKRTQVEIDAIAMKKTVEFEINYHQIAVRNIARQLILSARVKEYVQDF